MYIVFGQPLIEEAEIEEVAKSLRAAWLGTGPKVAAFEKLVAEYKGVAHAVALNSCTAGLHLCCLALDLQPGDEVIVPAMTFCATVNAVIHAGATPILVRTLGSSGEPRPSRSTLPSSGRSNPTHIAMVVLLPAPLGPRSPKISPRLISSDSPSTATVAP